MSEYIPACDIYTDGDFEFSAKIEEEDEETGEVTISISRNPRCNTCFKLEECLAEINAVIEGAFELEEEDMGLGGDITVN